MGMKFDTLFFGGIFSLLRRLGHIETLHGRVDLAVELTVSDRAADADISAFSVFVIQKIRVFRRREENTVNSVCIISEEELIKDHVLILTDQTLRLGIHLDLTLETDDRIG